jgi:hypothetical protein
MLLWFQKADMFGLNVCQTARAEADNVKFTIIEPDEEEILEKRQNVPGYE